MFAFKKTLCREMGLEPVPNNHHLFVKMMMQLRQPENKILGHARTVHDREMKFHFVTDRCYADETEAGLIASRESFTQERRLADLSPGGAANRHERETAFVRENQECAELFRFFFMRFHAWRVQRRTASPEYLCDFTTGICGESPSVGRMCRTLRGVISTPNSLRIKSATMRDVQRSAGYPAAIAPARMNSLSRCFSLSDKHGDLPEPFLRARQAKSLSFSRRTFRHRQTVDGVTSRICAISRSLKPLRINSPPCRRLRDCSDKVPCLLFIDFYTQPTKLRSTKFLKIFFLGSIFLATLLLAETTGLLFPMVLVRGNSTSYRTC